MGEHRSCFTCKFYDKCELCTNKKLCIHLDEWEKAPLVVAPMGA